MENNPFDDILSITEAAEMWGKETSTLRRVFTRCNFVYGVDVKRVGNQWLVRRSSMQRVYGDPVAKPSEPIE